MLAWLWKNGIDHVIIQIVAVKRTALRGAITVLEWAIDCGYDFTDDGSSHACMYAARNGNLPALQWLCQNDHPWDSPVVYFAGEYAHSEIADWAIANGCPDLDVEDGLDWV